MSNDDGTHTALGRGQESSPETEVVVDSTKTQAEALAWSVGDTDEVVPYAEHRSLLHRLGPAAAAALALVAVGVTVTVFVGRDKPAPAAPTAKPAPPPVVRGPIDGTYRVDRYRSESTIRMPGGRLSAPNPDYSTVETEWWAFQSVCPPSGCTAVGTRLDNTTHRQIAADLVPNMPESERTQGLRLTGGEWKTDPPNKITQPCGGDTAAEDTWRWTMELTQLPDGTLKGQESDVIETNECRGAGNVITTPVVATRTGDLPPTLPPLNAK